MNSQDTTSPMSSNTLSATATPPPSTSKLRFASSFSRLYKYIKGHKRSNRTASTTSFCDDDDESYLDDFGEGEIIIKGLKKKLRKRGVVGNSKSWSPMGGVSSSGSLSSLSSSRRSGSGRNWRIRKTQTERDEEMLMALLDMGQAELLGGHGDRAYACWREALKLSRDAASPEIAVLYQCALWKLAMFHIQQQCREPSQQQIQKPQEDEGETNNRSEALAYLHQIDFDSSPTDWLEDAAAKEKEASLLLVLLMEALKWQTALRLAESMSKEDVSRHTLECIRFQIAQQSGSVELLEACCCEDRELQRQVLFALSRAYAQRRDWDLALETNSRLESTTPLEKAEVYAQKAEFCLSANRVELAWEALSEGFHVAGDDTESEQLLLQTKAQLLYKSGNFPESLDVHQELLSKWRTAKGPVCPEVAKTYYTMGRIWCKANNAYRAIECFRQELHVTQLALGKNHSEVARILHEIARLHDEQLGEYDQALQFYQKALAVEQLLLEECRTRAKTSATHQQRYREHLQQIRETQKCMGRIHYKMGDFGMAVRTSFDAGGASPNNAIDK